MSRTPQISHLVALIVLGWIAGELFGWTNGVLTSSAGLAPGLAAAVFVLALVSGALVGVTTLCLAWLLVRRTGWIRTRQ